MFMPVRVPERDGCLSLVVLAIRVARAQRVTHRAEMDGALAVVVGWLMTPIWRGRRRMRLVGLERLVSDDSLRSVVMLASPAPGLSFQRL